MPIWHENCNGSEIIQNNVDIPHKNKMVIKAKEKNPTQLTRQWLNIFKGSTVERN